MSEQLSHESNPRYKQQYPFLTFISKTTMNCQPDCICGRHKQVRVGHTTDAPIDSVTGLLLFNPEYSSNYLNLPIEVRRGKAAPQELQVGGEFYGMTERYLYLTVSRKEYVLKEMPPRFKVN
jgi:hypothetical protein